MARGRLLSNRYSAFQWIQQLIDAPPHLQQTIPSPVIFEGPGIHSGVPGTIVLRPLPEDYGIRFGRGDCSAKHSCSLPRIEDFVRLDRRTGLLVDGEPLETVEHLMAALARCRIDNVCVSVGRSVEVPILNGSAKPFIDELTRVKVQMQSRPRRYSVLTRAFSMIQPGSRYEAEPSSSFSVRITLRDVGHDVSLFLSSSSDLIFDDAVAARTYVCSEDLEALRASGLIKGLTTENCRILNCGASLNGDEKRENALHKLADFVGDAALLIGGLPRAEFRVVNPHHAHSLSFLLTILRSGRLLTPDPDSPTARQ